MNVVYVNHGLANKIEDRIEIHEDIKRYPTLHKELISHEMSHTDKWFTLHDLKIDIFPGYSPQAKSELKAFKRKHKREVRSQLNPFKNGINVNLLILYVFFTLMVYSVMRLVLWIGQ